MDFIRDLVIEVESLTKMIVEANNQKIEQEAKLLSKEQTAAISSLEVGSQDEPNSYQAIGHHLREQYDTTKDPNTWVSQLYTDMCRARSIASKNEENYKLEKEKNNELINQIQLLETDL